VDLRIKLEQRYSLRVIHYETFLAGDFNIEFTKRFSSSKIMKKWQILENGGFEIISQSDIGSTSKSGKEIDFVMKAVREDSQDISEYSQHTSQDTAVAGDTIFICGTISR